MTRSQFYGRIATVYFPSSDELKEWSKSAESAGTSLSKYILDMVTKARTASQANPKDWSAELEGSRREILALKKENQEKSLLLEHYETELYKARHKAFQEVDSDDPLQYDNRLVTMLRIGKTLDSYRILSELGIDLNDSQAVKLVKTQLEELRRFGLVKETPSGWRWVG